MLNLKIIDPHDENWPLGLFFKLHQHRHQKRRFAHAGNACNQGDHARPHLVN